MIAELVNKMFQIEKLWRFSSNPASYGELLLGNYHWQYVVASILIAALAAFATLSILDKLKLNETFKFHSFWLFMACFTLSLGVWAMHFTGMIAFVLPRAMQYDPWVTAASVLPMLVGSWIALSTLVQPNPNWLRIQFGASFMALGIGSMHYLGMEAMQINGVNLYYNPWIFLASLFIAHGLACTVVYTYGIGEKLISPILLKPITALLMGIAISSMHYSAMLAASYVADSNAGIAMPHNGHNWLPIAVLCISTLILSSIALISFIDNKLKHSNRRLARSERLILRAGKLAGIGGWELQNGELFTTSHLTTMLPILKNRSTAEFLKIVDPGGLASNIAGLRIGEQLVQHVRIQNSVDTLIFQSQCELIAQGHLFGYLQDVTASMNREKALDAARELAEIAANTRSQFVANMSHELRTPMNGVLGMTSLLEETELNEEQEQLVKVVHESGEAMLAIINKVLDFSKLEAGNTPVETIAFDLEQLVCECLSLGIASALEKSTQLHLSWQPELPFSWLGDPTKIRQALANLISNAIKFTDKGVICVSVTHYYSDENSGVEISVVDTGVGLTQDQLTKVFDPFHQADASTTRKFGGTGLGLSITKHLVDVMAGSIHVVSDDCKGATFTIRIPMQENPDRHNELPDFKNFRIAIVSSASLLFQETMRTLEFRAAKVVAFNSFSAFHNSNIENKSRWHTILVDASIFAEIDDFAFAIKKLPVSTNTIVAANFGASLDHHNIIRKPFGPVELINRIEGTLLHSEEIQKPNQAPHSSEISNLKVLLAEDNIVNQKVTMSMLSKLGMQADLVENGHQALNAIEGRHYDVILMDMQMPLLDGIDATRAIRSRKISQPWIIAATANASEEDRERCLAAGMNDHLAKPIKMKDIEMALNRALNN